MNPYDMQNQDRQSYPSRPQSYHGGQGGFQSSQSSSGEFQSSYQGGGGQGGFQSSQQPSPGGFQSSQDSSGGGYQSQPSTRGYQSQGKLPQRPPPVPQQPTNNGSSWQPSSGGSGSSAGLQGFASPAPAANRERRNSGQWQLSGDSRVGSISGRTPSSSASGQLSAREPPVRCPSPLAPPSLASILSLHSSPPCTPPAS